MLYNLLKLLHLASIIVWIGGMVFAHFFLRPAAQVLEAPQRVRLMHDVLQRFFAAVTVAIVVVLGSGLWMIGRVAKQAVQSGGSFAMPLSWTLMATSDWPLAGKALGRIRTGVAVNLALGGIIVATTLLM